MAATTPNATIRRAADAIELAAAGAKSSASGRTCGKRIGVEADGSLGEHGTMAADCPGERAAL